MKSSPHYLVLAAAVCSALLSTPLPVRAQDTGPTPFPDPKNEAAWPGQGPIRVHPWMIDNRKYFWDQRAKNQGAVVFTGDSLTGNWKTLAASFPGLKVANRGVGGDTSRGVLFRFREDVLSLKPRAIVLLAGANDLSAHGNPAHVEANLAAMIDMARKDNPTVPIVLCGQTPRDSAVAPTKPGAEEDLRARTAKLGTGKENLVYVDLYAPLATPEGKPKPECFAADKLHLAEPGYKIWAELLKPAFDKLGVK